MAWDEWKKNTLARHAEVYPDIWYNIWSGPDTLNSTLSSKHPGETVNSGFLRYTDFPIAAIYIRTPARSIPRPSCSASNSRKQAWICAAPAARILPLRFAAAWREQIETGNRYEGW